MKAIRIIGLVTAMVTAGLALPGSLAAQEVYPSREVTLVVSYAPGGVTDLQARVVARRMEKALGVSFIVKNMPGAQGTLGQDFVRRARPDGYTLALVTSSSTALSPYLVNNVYNPTDFDYVGGVGLARFGLLVKADAPYQNIEQLVESSKSKPIFYGSSSAVITLGFDELVRKSGARFEPVNYKSGPETVAALIGGQISALMQAPNEVMAHIDSGRMRLLASAGPQRWPSAPEVPTLREAGYNVSVESWGGVAAPKGVPRAVMDKLQDALRRVASDSATVEELNRLGIHSTPLSGEEFGQKMQSTYLEAAPIMKAMVKK